MSALRRLGYAALGLVLASAVVASAACSSADTQCECADPALRVLVPPESAVAVTELRLTGPACEGVTWSCSRPGTEGGCATYQFTAKAAGACHVEVVFVNGTYTRDVTIVASTGCCEGFRADPSTASDINVVPPVGAGAPIDGGADA
jgi:hypothetical protein